MFSLTPECFWVKRHNDSRLFQQVPLTNPFEGSLGWKRSLVEITCKWSKIMRLANTEFTLSAKQAQQTCAFDAQTLFIKWNSSTCSRVWSKGAPGLWNECIHLHIEKILLNLPKLRNPTLQLRKLSSVTLITGFGNSFSSHGLGLRFLSTSVRSLRRIFFSSFFW